MKRLFLWLLPLAVLPTSGCGLLLKRALQGATQSQSSVTKQADVAYVSTLTPISKSGPGVVVFEPVIDSSAKTSANLGTGIGRYLHFYVAGQGEFGKTTTLGHLDEVRRQYKLANWQVAVPTDAKSKNTVHKYTKSLGATHYAVGKFAQRNGGLQLSYTLYSVNGDKKLGSWQVNAPKNGIPAKLPILARQMSVAIGAKSPVFPAKLSLTADDLSTLGAIPFLDKRKADKLPIQTVVKLRSLASKDALAAALLVRTDSYLTTKTGVDSSQNAVKLARNNALALSEPASSQFSETVTEAISPQIDAFNKKFPNNALGNHAAFWRAINEKDTAEEVTCQEKAVREAPTNAYFWRYLSVAIMDDAEAIRNSRYSSNISRSEWAMLDDSYAKAVAVSQHTVKIDPNYSFGWSRLTVDATFLSDTKTAFMAVERALAIDPENEYAWRWGAQLSQPKWFGSKAEYVEFQTRAAASANLFDINVEDIRRVLVAPNRGDLRDILEIVVKKDPNNVEALSELGQYYHYDEASYPRAEALYRQALAINPNHGSANSSLGNIIYYTKQDPKTAEKYYLKAIAADPKDGYFYGNLGVMYAQTGRQKEAVAMALKAKQFGLGTPHPIWDATGVTPP